MDLFDVIKEESLKQDAPLAERMKPKTLDDFVGQSHILSEGKLLNRLIKADKISSIIFYGPPGTGKTSIARVIANTTKSAFESLNAVTSGVKDLRRVVELAESNLGMYQQRTILFLDEIHRFNKAQQDALLPHVEKGTIILIGATTENPYYEVNNALISRSMIFRLERLTTDEIKFIVRRATQDGQRGLGMLGVQVDDEALSFIAQVSAGDARKALNAIELAVLSTEKKNGTLLVTTDDLKECVQRKGYLYDKAGDSHYDIISAFIKSMRGSDPDAALHYLARMIQGGEDPKFIARRIVIAASEDVGNADPNALVVATTAAQAVNMIGMPEGRIILAQAATYVASAPKSNAAYKGINEALQDLESIDIGLVPYYLKDGTSLSMSKKREDWGDYTYKYPHDYEMNYVPQQYLPDELKNTKYYRPTDNGVEKDMKAHLEKLKGVHDKPVE